MTPAQRKVIKTGDDITSLCSAAVDAYYSAGKNAASKTFVWRGKKFKATWTFYCVRVNDMQGNPIAERFW